MTQAQRLNRLQVTIAEFVVVRDITAAQTSRFDSNLELTRTRVGDRASFLFAQSTYVLRLSCKHPTNCGQRGMRNGTARLPALDPVVHAGHLPLPLKTLNNALTGLGRGLLMLTAPLRERVGG